MDNSNHDSAMRKRIGPGCSIRKHGNIWYIIFTDKTRSPGQKEKTLKTDNESKAMAIAFEMLRQYELGTLDPWSSGDSTAPVQKALKHYLREIPGNESRIKCARLVERIAEKHQITLLAAISPEKISRFIYQPQFSDTTKHSYYKQIAACINWLFEKGYWKVNPMNSVPKPTEPQTIPRHYSEEDFERFLVYCENYIDRNKAYTRKKLAFPKWFIPCFELIAYTGMRPAEAMRLNWGDIIWPEDSPEGIGMLLIMGPIKNKVEGTITMHPRAERVLRWMQDNHRISKEDDEPVLKNSSGKERISKSFLGTKFTRIQKYSKMEAIGLYGLRHTYAAYLRKKGVALHLIQEEFRHKDYRTTQRYGKLGVSERMKAVFDRISG